MAELDKNKRDPSIVINGPVAQGPGSVIGADNSGGKLSLEQRNYQFNYFFEYRGQHDRWKHVTQFIALFSGLGMIATVVAIASYKNEMSDALYTFLRIVLALGGAGFAVCIDGFLKVRFKAWLRATGGFAVFVIIFFFQVADASSAKHPTSRPTSQSSMNRVPSSP